jgi:hypothetical protein
MSSRAVWRKGDDRVRIATQLNDVDGDPPNLTRWAS